MSKAIIAIFTNYLQFSQIICNLQISQIICNLQFSQIQFPFLDSFCEAAMLARERVHNCITISLYRFLAQHC